MRDTTPELDQFARKPWYAARSDELAGAMRQGDVGAFPHFVLMHRGLARQLSKRLRRWGPACRRRTPSRSPSSA